MGRAAQDPEDDAEAGEAGPPEGTDLTGAFLIAMPGMSDPRFRNALVFLCAHSRRGAMGVIVNKPLPGTSMAELLEQLEIGQIPEPGAERGPETGLEAGPESGPAAGRGMIPTVQFGGPVEMHRGFVLHSDDWSAEDGTLAVEGGFALTATLDVLRELVAGRGPGLAMLALGYAGWGPGQLETELAQNGWLTAPADRRIVFELPNARKWEAALALLGVDPLFLSAEGGRA